MVDCCRPLQMEKAPCLYMKGKQALENFMVSVKSNPYCYHYFNAVGGFGALNVICIYFFKV